MTIHETVKELDAGPIAAQRGVPIAPEDDAGAVFARAAELAVELLDEVLPEPTFAPQQGEATYAAKLEPADRELDSRGRRTSSSTACGRSRRTSARAASCTGAVTVWRARVGEDGAARARRGAAGGGRRMPYDAWLRGLR